jgi:hypothetical protein
MHILIVQQVSFAEGCHHLFRSIEGIVEHSELRFVRTDFIVSLQNHYQGNFALEHGQVLPNTVPGPRTERNVGKST